MKSIKTHQSAVNTLRKHANKTKAVTMRGFFKKCRDDEVFLGVATPIIKTIAKEFAAMSMLDVKKLMHSNIHEERSLAHAILRLKFAKADTESQEKIYLFYIKNRKAIREWDGVDDSAPYIVGVHLLERDKKILYELAVSKSLWDRRIAIVATWWFIRNEQHRDTMRLAEMLLQDKEDLIHKAVGWMLREVGKRDEKTLKNFLNKHHKIMPRTMLRYAIEKFSEPERKRYLAKA